MQNGVRLNALTMFPSKCSKMMKVLGKVSQQSQQIQLMTHTAEYLYRTADATQEAPLN